VAGSWRGPARTRRYGDRDQQCLHRAAREVGGGGSSWPATSRRASTDPPRARHPAGRRAEGRPSRQRDGVDRRLPRRGATVGGGRVRGHGEPLRAIPRRARWRDSGSTALGCTAPTRTARWPSASRTTASGSRTPGQASRAWVGRSCSWRRAAVHVRHRASARIAEGGPGAVRRPHPRAVDAIRTTRRGHRPASIPSAA
jgi:hypothetical protein